uniref:C3H1-type domain-containing protein n=1 Tax=Macrostomum lignano TaxID=282301 RepID=A0A1I8J5T1_9PLAT
FYSYKRKKFLDFLQEKKFLFFIHTALYVALIEFLLDTEIAGCSMAEGLFESFDEIECHSKWLPELNCDSQEVDKILEELHWQSDNYPWLKGLCLLAIAHLHTLPGSCDIEKAREKLESIKPCEAVSGDLPQPDVKFLVKAMELKLRIMESQPSLPSKYKDRLEELSNLWKDKSVQATCFVAKGWTMHWFAVGNNREDSFQICASSLLKAKSIIEGVTGETEKLKVVEFICLYSLAFAFFRRRENHHRLCNDEFVCWDNAYKILTDKEWRHPIFLLEFARAVSCSPGHVELCKKLLAEEKKNREQQEKYYQTYIILPDIFSWLKKTRKNDTFLIELEKDISSLLEEGRKIEKLQQHKKFLRRIVEFLISCSRREDARELLQNTKEERNTELYRPSSKYWFEITLIALEIPKTAKGCQKLQPKEIESFLYRLENLCTNVPSKARQVRLTKGIFLIKCGYIDEGMKCLAWAMNDYLHPAQSFKPFLPKEIKEAKTVLEETTDKKKYLNWVESQFETHSAFYHVDDSIQKYQTELNRQDLTEDETFFITEHLGRLLLRKYRFEEAEQKFRSLPEALEHKNAMIADSLLCQAESLSSGDDVTEVCKAKLQEFKAQPDNAVHTTSIGMRLYLLNECAKLGCRDAIHEALLLLEDIRKQSHRDHLLQQAPNHLFLHSTCVYVFCSRLLRLRERGFQIERRKSFVDSGGDQMGDMLDKVEQILATELYPRRIRLKMTQLSLKYESVEEMLQSPEAERSIWHTLEESRKALDSFWAQFVSKVEKQKHGSQSKAIYYPYYPFARRDLKSSNDSFSNLFKNNWRDQAKLFTSLLQTMKSTVECLDKANENGVEINACVKDLEDIDEAKLKDEVSDDQLNDFKQQLEKLKQFFNPATTDPIKSNQLAGSIKRLRNSSEKFNEMLQKPFPLAFRANDEVCKWMIRKEEAIDSNHGCWHVHWCDEVNSDKHIYPVDVAKFNEKIKERFNQKQSGPVDVLALAHYAAEFAEEARLVLEEYTYPEVTIPTKPDAIGENFEWSLVCYSCAQPNDVLRSRWSRLQNECANCDKCILLVREKASAAPSDVWQRVRPRPRKLVKLDMCRRYSDIESCNGCKRSECDFAHGDAELRLWELERIGKFSFNKLLKSNRSAGSELPLILCERPAVEEGSETRIFYTGLKPLIPARLPVKAQNSCYSLCNSLLEGTECQYQGKCFNAHCAEEEQLWNIMQQKRAGFRNRQNRARTHWLELESSCDYKLTCYRCSESLDPLRSRFKLKETQNCERCDQSILLVRSKNNQINKWQRIRDRQGHLVICDLYQSNKCRRSECDFAHGDVELKLWKLERIGKFSFNKLLKSNRSAM